MLVGSDSIRDLALVRYGECLCLELSFPSVHGLLESVALPSKDVISMLTVSRASRMLGLQSMLTFCGAFLTDPPC
jgi:hypothetical protein